MSTNSIIQLGPHEYAGGFTLDWVWLVPIAVLIALAIYLFRRKKISN